MSNYVNISRITIFVMLVCFSFATGTETHLRVSQAAFFPAQKKQITIMSSDDQKGKVWRLFSLGKEIAAGTVLLSVEGVKKHSPFPFNHRCELPEITSPGKYRFFLGDDTVSFSVDTKPYAGFLESSLRYLKVQRSGTKETLDHEPGHFGDSAAFVMIRKKDTDLWIEDPNGRMLDMQGGWYSAGNFEKFTSSVAFTTYHLLRSWEADSTQFIDMKTSAGIPALLEEAQFGLKYLMKCMPDDTTFVIQCGGFDSENGSRLPAWDRFDGKRPCLTAISPGDMGISAAALALGAKLFKGRSADDALAYKMKAEKMFRVGSKPGLKPVVVKTDYELFPDREVRDNLLLGAAELFRLTNDSVYYAFSEKMADQLKSSSWISWMNQTLPAHLRFAQYHENSLFTAREELRGYLKRVQQTDNLWSFPIDYDFCALYGALSAAASAGVYENYTGDSQYRQILESVLRYTFGENNWGISFMASEKVSHSVREVYNPVYRLRKRYFPEGAIVVGPCGTETHRKGSIWVNDDFSARPSHKFNTEIISFYDHYDDFMTSDCWVLGVAENIHLMTQATVLFSKGASK